MRIFLTKQVKKWFDGQKNVLVDDLLCAASDVAAGTYEGNLGGNIYKKRIANSSRGKRGGSRMLVAYKQGSDLFFMYSYNKNDLENINAKEKKVLKARADIYFKMTSKDLKRALEAKIFLEIGRVK